MIEQNIKDKCIFRKKVQQILLGIWKHEVEQNCKKLCSKLKVEQQLGHKNYFGIKNPVQFEVTSQVNGPSKH